MMCSAFSRTLRRGAMMLTLAAVAVAARGEDLHWYLVANNTAKLPMTRVGLLVAADDDTDFSVLDLNGNVLLEGVRLVTFEQLSAAKVADLTLPGQRQNLLHTLVDGELTLIGASGLVRVYSLAGVKLMQTMAQGGETRLDVSGLPSATYIVSCGEKTFKFIKK